MNDRMRTFVLVITGLLSTHAAVHAQYGWQMQPVEIQTKWAKEVSASNVLPEYPRPQMTRGAWQNLNGLWEYAVTGLADPQPQQMEGQIMVPFAIESALSGVKKPLLPEQRLWYKRSFKSPAIKGGKRVLLHFGAVDQQTSVSVNGKPVGEHSGGYDAFSFDITDALKPSGENELVVSVLDPSDKGNAPYGKQTLRPRFILYTAISGIWQTVWLETVSAVHISDLYMTPDVDKKQLQLQVNVAGNAKDYVVEAQAKSNGQVISTTTGAPGAALQLPVQNAHLWSPADPFLYDLSIRLLYKGKVVDTVGSYFGMRKIAIQKDEKGMDRIFLNGAYTYNLGVLDQGYWPDGLYTAPTDEALRFDVETIKNMGFNTIRKHIKIEPARWYYYCDKLGMLVWQDMPCWLENGEVPAAVKKNFEAEMAQHLRALHNSPSIITWVLFNENWGSYDQLRLTKWIRQTDSSRLINGHTGPFVDQTWEGADMTDIHLYPDPAMPPYNPGRAMICGEFGGNYVAVPDHEWIPKKGWGHRSPPGYSFTDRYRQMMDHLLIYEKEGLSGSIFTQPFDVECEENGILTYDRAVYKIPADTIRQLNAAIMKAGNNKIVIN